MVSDSYLYTLQRPNIRKGSGDVYGTKPGVVYDIQRSYIESRRVSDQESDRS